MSTFKKQRRAIQSGPLCQRGRENYLTDSHRHFKPVGLAVEKKSFTHQPSLLFEHQSWGSVPLLCLEKRKNSSKNGRRGCGSNNSWPKGTPDSAKNGTVMFSNLFSPSPPLTTFHRINSQNEFSNEKDSFKYKRLAFVNQFLQLYCLQVYFPLCRWISLIFNNVQKNIVFAYFFMVDRCHTRMFVTFDTYSRKKHATLENNFRKQKNRHSFWKTQAEKRCLFLTLRHWVWTVYIRIHSVELGTSGIFSFFNNKKWFFALFIKLITYFCTSPI